MRPSLAGMTAHGQRTCTNEGTSKHNEGRARKAVTATDDKDACIRV